MIQFVFLFLLCTCFEDLFVLAGTKFRIVGGRVALDATAPYQVNLMNGGEHTCGGSIINKRWILTAAHCVHKTSADKITLKVGSNMLSTGGETYDAEKIVVHNEWNTNFEHDIALVKVSKEIRFNRKVKALRISEEFIDGDTDVTLTGWGFDGRNDPDNLMTIQTKVCSNDECETALKNIIDFYVPDSSLCTCDQEGKGMCVGDSGGALIMDHVQVGISSWIAGDCGEEIPNMFTRVSHYYDWIKENID